MSQTHEQGGTEAVDPADRAPGENRDALATGTGDTAVTLESEDAEAAGVDAEAAGTGADGADADGADADGERVAELSDEQIGGAIEALLLMAEEPVAATTLAEAVGAPLERITAVLQSLVEFYDTTGRGFELRHVGGGWRYWTRAEHADLIGQWVVSGQVSKLSQASLETLAVVAYLQPVSRARISAVRGVSVDGVIRTLLARDLIEEVGQDEQTGAVLFRTTDYFLERMGLQTLSELPAMAPHLPDAIDLEAELSDLAAPAEAMHTDDEPLEQEPAAQPGEEPGESEAAAGDQDGHNGGDGAGIGGPEPSDFEPDDEPPVGEAGTEKSEQSMGERTDD